MKILIAGKRYLCDNLTNSEENQNIIQFESKTLDGTTVKDVISVLQDKVEHDLKQVREIKSDSEETTNYNRRKMISLQKALHYLSESKDLV